MPKIVAPANMAGRARTHRDDSASPT